MLIAMLLMLVCGQADAGEFSWINAPRMHNPTATSVLVAAIPAQHAELQITWGHGQSSPVQVVRAGALYTYEVSGLTPGRVTTARVTARALGASSWEQHSQLKLRTLPPADGPVRFALMADTHAWALYSRPLHLGPVSPLEEMEAVLENVRSDSELDFGIVLTDSAMTNCAGGCKAKLTPLGPAAAGDAADLADALVRYRTVWGSEILGNVARELPLLTANGDHEGEQGWFPQDEALMSLTARERTLPPLSQGYIAGPPDTLAYAFEAGPTLIVVLDVHSATVRAPLVPEQWHLGHAQHEWLYDVLAGSGRRWKIVMAEHLLGGVSDPALPIWKARGSIKSTDDGTPTGTFVGEQALVHQAMLATGADMFVGAQDHVVAWGLKDGIAYLTAGRAGGIGFPWTNKPFYRQAMDFDGDGVPEYETGVTGTRAPGHVVIDADEDRLTVEYVRGSVTSQANNQVILSFELEQ